MKLWLRVLIALRARATNRNGSANTETTGMSDKSIDRAVEQAQRQPHPPSCEPNPYARQAGINPSVHGDGDPAQKPGGGRNR